MQLKRIDTLIALLDAFETMLASDADLELLRRSGRREIKWRMHALSLLAAERVEELTLALKTPPPCHAAGARTRILNLIAAVRDANRDAPEDPAMDHAFSVTATKLQLADGAIAALAAALDRDTPPSPLAQELDLNAFRARLPDVRAFLASQMDFHAPALRFGIRLALAMTAGLILTLLFPRFAHANWILLTTALIMRANYSVTSQRRWDRVTGTLVGCALAVGLIYAFPDNVLADRHRGLRGHQPCLCRGALPHHRDLRFHHRSVAAAFFRAHRPSAILRADCGHADRRRTFLGVQLPACPIGRSAPCPASSKACWRPMPVSPAPPSAAPARPRPIAWRARRRWTRWRFCRAPSAAWRMSPIATRRMLAALNELLGANYLLAADLCSVPILMRLHGDDLEHDADSWIGTARERVTACSRRSAR